MCFGIGIGFCLALIENMPYICLVTVPLLGSFYGAETIYRLSILLMVHSIVVDCIPNILVRQLVLKNDCQLQTCHSFRFYQNHAGFFFAGT